MRQTPLIVKEQIWQKLKENKTYKRIAEELNITERVARKWGQALKKR
jgi:DNA-binding CsgD family transcriptional regulator